MADTNIGIVLCLTANGCNVDWHSEGSLTHFAAASAIAP